MNMETIYIKLLGEGALAWRPVKAKRNVNGSFEIDPDVVVPEDEHWEFMPGTNVLCKEQTFSGGESGLIVYTYA